MYLIVFAISISYDVELISSMVYVIFHSLLSGMKGPRNKRPISNVSDADLLNKRNTPISKINIIIIQSKFFFLFIGREPNT